MAKPLKQLAFKYCCFEFSNQMILDDKHETATIKKDLLGAVVLKNVGREYIIKYCPFCGVKLK